MTISENPFLHIVDIIVSLIGQRPPRINEGSGGFVLLEVVSQICWQTQMCDNFCVLCLHVLIILNLKHTIPRKIPKTKLVTMKLYCCTKEIIFKKTNSYPIHGFFHIFFYKEPHFTKFFLNNTYNYQIPTNIASTFWRMHNLFLLPRLIMTNIIIEIVVIKTYVYIVITIISIYSDKLSPFRTFFFSLTCTNAAVRFESLKSVVHNVTMSTNDRFVPCGSVI